MRPTAQVAILVALWSALAPLGAQSVSRPPLRSLGPIVASSPTTFASVEEIRALKDGRVLVNVMSQRLIVMLDSTLRTQRVVLDSAASSPNSYGWISGFLFAGFGDTSLFLDPQSRAIVAIDGAGKSVGTSAMPPLPKLSVTGTANILIEQLAPYNAYSGLVNTGIGLPATSAYHGLVYPRAAVQLGVNAVNPTDTTYVTLEDSSLILAMNLHTRAVDTLASVATGGMSALVIPPGRRAFARKSQVSRILTTGDAWTVMADGSIAILHGQEYRLSWIDTARIRSESRPIPYPWKHLSDGDKQRAVDSANAGAELRYEASLAKGKADSAAGRPYPPTRPADGSNVPPQLHGPVIVPQPLHYDIDLLPDYVSPFVPGRRALMADADDNVWIRVGRPEPGEDTPAYDVVNRKGELIDRVRLPEGRELIGFGPGGTVYLIAHDGGKESIERARFK